jgi:hypothetical protein
MARPRRSYAWALHPEASRLALWQLSDEAQEGLDYARELAEDAELRRKQNIKGGERFAPLTLAELARVRARSPAAINRLIDKARRELFGEIGDSAIYKRLQRQRERPSSQSRPCREPGCEAQLPARAHGNAAYCERHARPAARVRRHRERKRQAEQAGRGDAS